MVSGCAAGKWPRVDSSQQGKLGSIPQASSLRGQEVLVSHRPMGAAAPQGGICVGLVPADQAPAESLALVQCQQMAVACMAGAMTIPTPPRTQAAIPGSRLLLSSHEKFPSQLCASHGPVPFVYPKAKPESAWALCSCSSPCALWSFSLVELTEEILKLLMELVFRLVCNGELSLARVLRKNILDKVDQKKLLRCATSGQPLAARGVAAR